MDSIYAEASDGRPAAFEVAAIAPRQNIKTSTFGIAALADFFVFGIKRHVWSSHLLDTSGKTFADFRTWIRSNPDYEDQVTFYEGHQDLKITRRDDPDRYIDFVSRTGKKGRGYTGVQRVTLDEWLYGEASHVGAIYPTMLTQRGAQIRLMSSAGLVSSKQLRAMRERGRSGKDKRLAYVEYGAPVTPCADPSCGHTVGTEGCALDDRSLWWAANCALWQGRVSEDSLENLRNSMPPEEFMREFLSWWEDPEVIGGVFGESWLECVAEKPEGLEVAAYGVAASLDLEHAAIVAAYVDGDTVHVKPIHVERGTSWVAGRLEALRESHPAPVAVDNTGPAAVLIPELKSAKVELVAAKSADVLNACAGIVESAREGRLAHASYPELNEAVRAAAKQPSGDRWKWGRKPVRGSRHVPNITPLEAATLAAWLAENPQSKTSAYASHDLFVIDI